MSDDAMIVYFDGDPDELASRFRVAATRYMEIGDGPLPASAHLLRSRSGISVVLIWPPTDPRHGRFRGFMRSVIGELGLPSPRVEHFHVDAATWEAIAAPS